MRTDGRPLSRRAPVWLFVVIVFLGMGALQGRAAGQQAQQVGDNTQIAVLPVQGNVSMIVTPGGNITVSVGKNGVLLVDTAVAQVSDKVLTAIRSLASGPIRFIINTSLDVEHTGGNASLTKAGNNVAIIAHENVLTRMSASSGNQPAVAFAFWPSLPFPKKKEVFFNGEGIEIFHQPDAHTDGDSIVFFRRSDVVSTGDIFVTTTYPVIDTARGGTIDGVIAGLNHILSLTIPENIQEGGTRVIPGHGRLCDEDDVVEYRDMVTIIRDRVLDLMKKGMTLDQVKTARPTKDYDNRYGATTGSWTPDMFVEAVYRTLGERRAAPLETDSASSRR